MIKFSPLSPDELPSCYSHDSSLNGYVGFDMNDDKICGYSVFRLNGYSMDIIDILSDADDETVEGFIRSSLNYGANRGAYIAFYSAEKGRNVAISLGFSENGNGIFEGEIPELLAGHCCKNK